jgi:hypothetical protein
MAARRLILAMLVLLVLSSVAAALIPVDRRQSDESETTSTTPATTTPTEDTKLITKRVSADARKPPRIRMRTGDELRLTVASPVPNSVEIEEFGDFKYVDPDFPARFDIFPFEAGTAEVRLVDPPGLVATIEIAP